MESNPVSEKDFDMELEEDLPQTLSKVVNWKEITQTNYPIPFIPRTSLPFERPKNLEDFSPVGLFKAFFNESLWEYLVTQTNLYLKQKKEENDEYLKGHPYARLNKFTETNKQQIERWMAIRLLVPIPSNTKLSGHILFSTTTKFYYYRQLEQKSSSFELSQSYNERR